MTTQSLTKKVFTTTCAAVLAAGGFALGRMTHGGSIPAAAGDVAPPASPAPPPLAASGNGRARAAPMPSSFAPLVAEASPAVVHIKVTSVVKTAGPGLRFGFPPDWFGENGPFGEFRFPAPPSGEFEQHGSGSGFIIRKDGMILTNNHVVDGAKAITVTLSDGRQFAASVVGRDPKTDLAVLKIHATGALPVATLGSSDAVRVGDWVIAIGNPFGLSNTVTAGIVSAKGRAIGAGPYEDFIQTDAPINPGNSGGPLLDEQGEVIGINTMIFSQSGGNIGIGFAIPIDLAKQLVPDLEEHGHVTRGGLGVAIQKITPDLAASLGVEPERGVLVAQVAPESPAAKSGLKSGDVITTYDGKAIDEHASLPMLVAETTIGKTVPVEILRDGKTTTLEVTIARLTEDEARDETSPPKAKWGLALREPTPAERQSRNLDASQGVLVEGVAPESPAAEAGVHAGDVILEVNRKPVRSVEALQKAVAATPAGKPLLLLLRPADGSDRFTALAAR